MANEMCVWSEEGNEWIPECDPGLKYKPTPKGYSENHTLHEMGNRHPLCVTCRKRIYFKRNKMEKCEWKETTSPEHETQWETECDESLFNSGDANDIAEMEDVYNNCPRCGKDIEFIEKNAKPKPKPKTKLKLKQNCIWRPDIINLGDCDRDGIDFWTSDCDDMNAMFGGNNNTVAEMRDIYKFCNKCGDKVEFVEKRKKNDSREL